MNAPHSPAARTLLAAVGVAIASVIDGIFPGSAAAQCEPQQILQPEASYPAGAYAIDIQSGDFNEDGILDLVSANYNAGNVTVFLGLGSAGVGNGTFAPGVNYPTGQNPRSIATGDFNEDGITDLAVPLMDPGQVAILLGGGSGGVGNGTFSAPVTYPCGPESRFVATGDFNEDGITDLAVTNSAADRVAIMLGQGSGGVGNGTFGAPTGYATGYYPWGVEPGDYDGDGITDLVVTNALGGTVVILKGQGTGGVGNGSFVLTATYPAPTWPEFIAKGDFNEDGITDLAIVSHNDVTLTIFLGQGTGGVGNGTFAPQPGYPAGDGAADLVVADFDHDGILDIAHCNVSYGRVSLRLGLGAAGVGDGTFGPRYEVQVGAGAVGMASGDFNEDGFLDLATANALGNNITVLFGGCVPPPPPPPPPSPYLTDVRDVPNDQGGRVFLTWLRSPLDDPSQRTVTGYRVWRRIPPAAASEALASGIRRLVADPGRAAIEAGVSGILTLRGGMAEDVTYWEALITLPAEGLEGYGYTAATTQDSMAGSNPYTAFFVSALTADPFVFYPSNVDSGYSVDNLPPGGPGSAAGEMTQQGYRLRWNPTRDADLAGYRLYRGETSNFKASDTTRIASPSDTVYVDRNGDGSAWYKVSAVDRNGNESPFALVPPSGIVDVGAAGSGVSLRLEANPSRLGRLVVSFSLRGAAGATLELLDLGGRRLRSVAVDAFGQGLHSVDLAGGRALAPGLYLVRLSEAGRERVLKACVLR
ncbi:MAG TPA: VCBS repeat-containing protein [Candidatus Eisenbacteria bacterium]|jgi:hypothetical protein